MKLWPQSPTSQDGFAQAQCPNCGSYGDPIGSMWREWHTGRTFQHTTVLDTQTSSIILIGSLLGCTLLANWLFGTNFLWIGLVTGVILALVLIALQVARNVSRETHASRVLRYKCRRCLHQWDQEDGKPPPRYNERQEILADYHSSFGTDDRSNNSGT